MPARSSQQRFSDRVDNYVRYRPGYPSAVIDLLRRETGLRADAVVADIGSGTGISAKMFLEAGCTIFGVEPNREMRLAAERLLSGYANFHSMNGTAEATTLKAGSVDLIVAAQAFHWFDREPTRAEWTRLLKPHGRVVLIWNERQLDSTPFLRDYEQLLLDFGTDYTAVRHENIDANRLKQFFAEDRYQSHHFDNHQRFDFEGLKGRLLSSSYAPAPGEPGHDEMLAALHRIFVTHKVNENVIFHYDTRVYLGR